MSIISIFLILFFIYNFGMFIYEGGYYNGLARRIIYLLIITIVFFAQIGLIQISFINTVLGAVSDNLGSVEGQLSGLSKELQAKLRERINNTTNKKKKPTGEEEQ